LGAPSSGTPFTSTAEIASFGFSGNRRYSFDPAVRVTDCGDAKDNKYLELALAAGADMIVSSDDDLLTLHPWRGIPVLRPAAYLGER
jgi:predicted nucleic acid-binding protein